MKKTKKELPKANDLKIDKIGVLFKKSILKNILKMLTMEHAAYRTMKSVKNINRLFTHIDVDKYKNKELESYIWAIAFVSRQWLDGYVDIDIIMESLKRHQDYDNIKEDIVQRSIDDKVPVQAPEAKMLFHIIGEALQFGFVTTLKEEYLSLLDDISLDQPATFRNMMDRLFLISQSLLDIKHNTNLVANKISFNTGDLSSIKESISQTIQSLSGSNNIFKTGIKRLNTLLSPGYMNGRLYIYLGLPASFKSGLLLKSALDIRKYNPGYITKTPGMKPCVLYITMENTFTETIERIWSMNFDDSITNYSEAEALEKICNELGIQRVLRDDVVVTDKSTGETLMGELLEVNKKPEVNIEVIMQYYSYREISTDDLFTIIQDLRDENYEVCALVFDYIKRIRPSIPVPDNEKLELERIGNELKAVGGILDIPIVTAHQLNRVAASLVDQAARQGKGDVTKLAGREHIGSAWGLMETADWAAVLNIEYKPGTNEKYLAINVQKRRRIDSNDHHQLADQLFIVHPFSRTNGLRLIDDMLLDKVLSLKSLSLDIDVIGNEKTNAVQRKLIETETFISDEDDY